MKRKATAVRSSPIACGACGSRYGDAAWLALDLVDRISAPELRRLLLDWAEEFYIEVRRCGRCGKEIPAKAMAPS
jgi:hypothetical protein